MGLKGPSRRERVGGGAGYFEPALGQKGSSMYCVKTLLHKLYCICLIPWGLCRVPCGEILEQKTEAYIGEVWYTIARN